jgi:cobalamin synthase
VSDHPVQVVYAPDPGQSRLWGIPLIGLLVRAILVIPQAIVLTILGYAIGLGLLVSWIPILLTGRMPRLGYTLFGGYLRLSTQVTVYTLLMTGSYPPFWLRGEHAATVTFDETEVQNRLWGIPVAGLVVRWVLLIPHFLALLVLGIVVAILTLVTWVPILLNGRTGDWVVRWIGGTYRWAARVFAYALLLTEHYPPFSLD